MLKAEAIRQNPEILQSLLTTTSSITRLAKTAAPEVTESNKDERAETSRSLAPKEDISAIEEHSPLIVPKWSGKSSIMAPNPAAPTFSLSESDIFGNGWFNLQPSVEQYSIRDSRQGDPDGDFAVKLIEKTLNMAYYSLIEYRHDPASFIMRMCRYALLYHSMDEVLFNLRWFLGPGSSAMKSLCRANFGFDHTLSAQSLDLDAPRNGPKVFSPFVDAQALLEASNKIPRLAFMNALDVEEYLKSKGAVHLDQDIVQIRAQGTTEAEFTDDLLFDFDQLPQKFDVSGSDQHLNPTHTHLKQNMFGIPEATPTNFHFAPNTSPTRYQPVSAKGRTISLCRSSLLENLARHSLCLGTGPAYPRASVDIAIESAIC